MNSNLILKADIIDIIFEKRNKDYGAYDLRKFYPDRLKASLGIMFLIAIVFSVFLSLPRKVTEISTLPFVFSDNEYIKLAEQPKLPEKKKEVAKTETTAKPANSQSYLSNLSIVNDKTKADTIQTLKETANIGSLTIVNSDPGPPLIQPLKSEPGLPATVTVPEVNKHIPFEPGTVDVPPAYPGGMEALRKFLEKNLNAPDPVEAGESVNVKVRFVVGYDGKLQSFKIVQDGGESFNKEVVRVLKKMPDWIPGKAKGEAVSVYYTIPVKFTGSD